MEDRRVRPRGRGWFGFAGTLGGALLLGLACSETPPDPLAGSWWAARRSAADRWLGELESLADTPLAREAGIVRARLPACPVVGFRDAAGSDLLEGSRASCLEPASALTTHLADRDVVFQVEHDDARLRGEARIAEDGWRWSARWDALPDQGWQALLFPGDGDVGPDRLSDQGRLVHLRMRPENGIDLAAFAPPGSQGDRLFRLRSDLFARAVLDGSFEVAVYAPREQSTSPRMAIALGVRSATAARAAARRFVDDLGATWSLTPSPLDTPLGPGACLLGLKILPEFSPCFVSGEDDLWVAWNPDSLLQALPQLGSPEAPTAPVSTPGAGRAHLDLRAIQETDGALANTLLGDAAHPPLAWPWASATLRLHRDGSGARIDVRLRRAPSRIGSQASR